MPALLQTIVSPVLGVLMKGLITSGIFLFADLAKDDLKLENEKNIVQEAKKGDNQAFTELYNHYFPKVYAYIIRRTGHQQTAEDITSKVFLKAFSKLPTFTFTGAPFGAWVFRIAANTLIDHYRKASNNKERATEHLPESMDMSHSAHEEVMVNETKELVLSLVAKLPPKDRQLVELRFLAELGVKEISAIVELSPNVVSVRIYRAIKKLKTLLPEPVAIPVSNETSIR